MPTRTVFKLKQAFRRSLKEQIFRFSNLSDGLVFIPGARSRICSYMLFPGVSSIACCVAQNLVFYPTCLLLTVPSLQNIPTVLFFKLAYSGCALTAPHRRSWLAGTPSDHASDRPEWWCYACRHCQKQSTFSRY